MTARADVGVCDLCGQELIRTEDDCWHPWDTPRACPPIAWDRGVRVLAFGDGHQRPGREHWRSTS